MPTKPPEKQPAEQEKQARQQLSDLIGKQVLEALGRPEDLYQVQSRPLWDDRYRVNIFVGPDASAIKLAHSYFVQADREGNISACTPELPKLATVPSCDGPYGVKDQPCPTP
jgi:hypothetical protein